MKKVCFMGSMKFAVPILENLHQHYDVTLVITQPDKPVGRKRILTPTPVKEKALALGIDVFQPMNIKQDHQPILEKTFDFLIVAAYGQMIPEVVLNHARYRAINVHASLLPKYRGGSPMHRAIQYGDEETGVTIMYMAKKMDAGDLLAQASIKINEADNVRTLEEKLSLIGSDLLIETLNKIDTITPQKQDEACVTYAYNIKPEEERLNFGLTANEVRNHVRGFYPWPCTYFKIGQLKMKVYDVEVIPDNLSQTIGEIVKADKKHLWIQTKRGMVSLKDVQLQGKKRMKIQDFMNGAGKSLFLVGKTVE